MYDYCTREVPKITDIRWTKFRVLSFLFFCWPSLFALVLILNSLDLVFALSGLLHKPVIKVSSLLPRRCTPRLSLNSAVWFGCRKYSSPPGLFHAAVAVVQRCAERRTAPVRANLAQVRTASANGNRKS